MTRATIFLASPALFPDLSPLAVWLGLSCVAVGLWVMWTADDALGDCEGAIRAMEAKDWLMNMQRVRVA